ncbi:MAG: SIR2 family protein [Acidobacteriota bacterium]|nr:SIR2 family protein [Acidobacteriota bacterium]
MSLNAFNVDSLNALADDVAKGRVVFFVGAGFSRDSEGNSAERLIARLLSRFLAVIDVAAAQFKPDDYEPLRRALTTIFDLKTAPDTWDTVKELASKYYATNDWMVTVYGQLLTQLKEDLPEEDVADFAERVNQIENRTMQDLDSNCPSLLPMELSYLWALGAPENGKALFLDTQGFACEESMAGAPEDPDITEVEKKYQNRFKPRHHILARLAREGLANPILTTNYDLLLEGAARLSGMGCNCPPVKGAPRTPFESTQVIRHARDFFDRAAAQTGAILLKFHGCALEYRRRRKRCLPDNRTEDDLKVLRRYLKAVVFTYREIQNWRQDHWSRDYLATLLRTRTTVFCSYSGADPVIHDTFRGIYEELGRHRSGTAQRAPAYFFGFGLDNTEFDGLELLRAAQHAVSEGTADAVDHPHYLRFSRRDAREAFPNADQHLQWVYHRALRCRQEEYLSGNLTAMSRRLFHKPKNPSALDRLRLHFRVLQATEVAEAGRWSSLTQSDPGPAAVMNWTWRFLSNCMSEYAQAEYMLNRHHGIRHPRLDHPEWYYPASANPDLATWVTVLEIAVRRMIAALHGRLADWTDNRFYLPRGPRTKRPGLWFQAPGHGAPMRLVICLDQSLATVPAPTAYKTITWRIPPRSIPWPSRTTRGLMPDSAAVWRWACDRKPDVRELKDFGF